MFQLRHARAEPPALQRWLVQHTYGCQSRVLVLSVRPRPFGHTPVPFFGSVQTLAKVMSGT